MLYSGFAIACSNTTISNCTTNFNDQYGVVISAANVTVASTLVNNSGLVAGYVWEGSGITCSNSCIILNSTIVNSGFAGLILGSNSYALGNWIESPMQTLADTGCIYSYGYTTTSITISGNRLIHNAPNQISSPVGRALSVGAAIYNDEATHNYTISNNYISYKQTAVDLTTQVTSFGFRANSAWNAWLYNNTFVGIGA